jgi:hypothetical protein
MGIDALLWPSGDDLFEDLMYRVSDEADSREYMKKNLLNVTGQDTDWNLESDRFRVWRAQDNLRWKLWRWLLEGDQYGRYYSELFGLVIYDHEAPRTVYRNKHNNPTIEVHSVRPALRRTIHGGVRTDLVVEITQRRRGYYDPAEQAQEDQQDGHMNRRKHGDFVYRAGATILIDPTTQEVRRVIRTPGTIKDDEELDRVRRYLLGATEETDNAFDAGLPVSIRSGKSSLRNEPFALLHQRMEE